ncbi:unnamed protein product [Dibothriocephalus latus]|uniref:Uncharacterized protein n=1 Tax=Dibothriocephalus latus TaxID=60516 RepID=A0A3P6R1Z9_DIBLA|nr:unnamed protein product [Dibothriocephalus latus]
MRIFYNRIGAAAVVDKGGLSGGAIAGIVIGVLLAVVLLAVLFLFLRNRGSGSVMLDDFEWSESASFSKDDADMNAVER